MGGDKSQPRFSNNSSGSAAIVLVKELWPVVRSTCLLEIICPHRSRHLHGGITSVHRDISRDYCISVVLDQSDLVRGVSMTVRLFLDKCTCCRAEFFVYRLR